MAFDLDGLFYYPVKSMKGLSSQELEFDHVGPMWDRRFMLVDEAGKFVTQRKYPQMSQLDAQVSPKGLLLSHQSFGRVSIDIGAFTQSAEVKVWSDEVSALSCPPSQTRALSDYLGVDVRLVWMAPESFRQVDREFFDAPRQVSFADGFPVLLTNTASLDDLNERLCSKGEPPVSMNRFRPNIVVSGRQAFEEDAWLELKVGEVKFAVVKPCSRCVMTTIDERGEKGREPLSTLSTYRRNDFGVCFGQNLVPLNEGRIRMNDVVEVTKYK